MRLITTRNGKRNVEDIEKPSLYLKTYINGTLDSGDELVNAVLPEDTKEASLNKLNLAFKHYLGSIKFKPKQAIAVEYYKKILNDESTICATARSIVAQKQCKIRFFHKYCLEYMKHKYTQDVDNFTIFMDDGTGVQHKKHAPVFFVKLITALALTLETYGGKHTDDEITDVFEHISKLFSPKGMEKAVTR